MSCITAYQQWLSSYPASCFDENSNNLELLCFESSQIYWIQSIDIDSVSITIWIARVSKMKSYQKSSGENTSPNLSNYMPYEILFPKFQPIDKSLCCCVWNKQNKFHGSWIWIMCLLSFKGTKSYTSTEQSSTCSLLWSKWDLVNVIPRYV